jgi:hypothetical protein
MSLYISSPFIVDRLHHLKIWSRWQPVSGTSNLRLLWTHCCRLPREHLHTAGQLRLPLWLFCRYMIVPYHVWPEFLRWAEPLAAESGMGIFAEGPSWAAQFGHKVIGANQAESCKEGGLATL